VFKSQVSRREGSHSTKIDGFKMQYFQSILFNLCTLTSWILRWWMIERSLGDLKILSDGALFYSPGE